MSDSKVKDGSAALKEKLLKKSGINFPFPSSLDFSEMPPIQFSHTYSIEYLHSYAQDSPFFLGLKNKKLLCTKCDRCDYTYATPRGNCMRCGQKTEWRELPKSGYVHAFTVCYAGSEKFLDWTPFVLVLIKFDGTDTLFLSRLKGVDIENVSLTWIGRRVRPRFKNGIGKMDYVPEIQDVWFEFVQ